MKRIIELSENDYMALKEEGVENHLALADTIIEHSVIYEERPQGEWIVKSSGTTHYFMCNKCGSAGDIQDKYCRECGLKMKARTENETDN